MESSIAKTLREVVIMQAGRDSWDAMLRRAALTEAVIDEDRMGDDDVRRLVQAACDTLHLHWIATFGAPVAGSASPRLSYEWKSQRTVVMHYESHRPLVDLLVALLVGLGHRVPDVLSIRRMSSRSVELRLAA